MESYYRLIKTCIKKGASDVHLTSGEPVVLRINGKLVAENSPSIPDVGKLFGFVLTEECIVKLKNKHMADFTIDVRGYRQRVHLYYSGGVLCAALRLFPETIPTPQVLRLPPNLIDLTHKTSGLILVTGATGSGKTTTLASLLNEINKNDQKHIFTLEDPVEYLFENQKSLIHQLEIGQDADDYASGLKAALRCDPDVLLVGEMRDAGTMETAITAAETGHLVFSTLHNDDAVSAVYRLLDSFEGVDRSRVAASLSQSLLAMVAQKLVPALNGNTRMAAFEVLLATPAVKTLIREDKLYQLGDCIATGKKWGMCTFAESFKQLVKDGSITLDCAFNNCKDKDSLRSLST